ncbi:MAG: family 43 glycosylhydrolase [Bacteroidales bacterium]|nr:family 43 glycosylhydrolase [Bacteroidales bacterium]
MKYHLLYLLVGVLFLSSCKTNNQKNASVKAPAPIFIDPNYHGSCDPEIVWNEHDSLWYIFYTSRRSSLENNFLRTPLGVISSKDLANWKFEGYCKFDGVGGTKDADETFWAPAIISYEGKLHMFVTYKPDTITTQGAWGGPGKIVHYETSLDNPVNGWKKVADMNDSTMNTIDATVYKANGTFHVWYKGKVKGAKKNELYHLVSTDLYNWESRGFSKSDVFNKKATGSGFEEAPFIFEWKDKHWLITDPHIGLFVYNSTDSEYWNFKGTILYEGGTRNLDNNMGRHCSVAVINDRAFIFYHVEPWRDYEGKPIYKQPVENRRAVLQMAELEFNGKTISCDRNKELIISLN